MFVVMLSNIIILLFWASLVLEKDVASEMVSMKIVDEPSSYGLSNSYGGLYQSMEEKLHARVKPANFSGPPHLKRLVGKCFNLIDENYKYEFCPFSNVTQHEQSLRWNPYSGVLGVYQEWHIKNNTFEAMMMKDGDACGDIYRSVKVFFKCGNRTDVTKVTEPHTCQYHMDFLSPLVCHPHAMLAYPILPRELQLEWDEVEGEFLREELTQQGYNKKLKQIFQKAGFYLTKEKQKQLTKEVEKKEPVKEEKNEEFESLAKCTEEVHRLQEEVKQLKASLISHGLSSTDHEKEAISQMSSNVTESEVKEVPGNTTVGQQ